MLNKKDFLSGLFLFGLGLFLVFRSNRLSVWSSGPDAGFLPFVLAIIIMGLSLLVIIKAFRLAILTRGRKKDETLEKQGKDVVNFFKVLSYIMLMLFYGILLERVGFLITSSLFLFLMLKFTEKQNWKTTLLVGLTSIIISFLFFKHILGIPLPTGLIKW